MVLKDPFRIEISNRQVLSNYPVYYDGVSLHLISYLLSFDLSVVMCCFCVCGSLLMHCLWNIPFPIQEVAERTAMMTTMIKTPHVANILIIKKMTMLGTAR